MFSQGYIPEAEVQRQSSKAEECLTQNHDPSWLPEEPQTSELQIPLIIYYSTWLRDQNWHQRNSLLITGHSHFSGITPSSSFEADMTIPHGQKLKVSSYSLRSNKFCSHKFYMWHLKC